MAINMDMEQNENMPDKKRRKRRNKLISMAENIDSIAESLKSANSDIMQLINADSKETELRASENNGESENNEESSESTANNDVSSIILDANECLSDDEENETAGSVRLSWSNNGALNEEEQTKEKENCDSMNAAAWTYEEPEEQVKVEVKSRLRHRGNDNIGSLFSMGRPSRVVDKPSYDIDRGMYRFKQTNGNKRESSKHREDGYISMADAKKADKEQQTRKEVEAITCGFAPRVSCETSKWASFSMRENTEADIEYMIIHEPNNICISYVCRYSKLSEAFIERMIALTTGVVCGVTTEDNIKELQAAMIDYMLSDDPDYKGRIVNMTVCNKLTDWDVKDIDVEVSSLKDKIDWQYISVYQKLSEEFILKWLNYLDHRLLLNNQVLSDKVKARLTAIVREDAERKRKQLERAAKDDIIASYIMDSVPEQQEDDNLDIDDIASSTSGSDLNLESEQSKPKRKHRRKRSSP